MQTQMILNIDSQTVELANLYASEKGMSISDLFESYVRLIVLNEQLFKLRTLDVNTVMPQTENLFGLKKTNWTVLDNKFKSIRKGYQLILNLIEILQIRDKALIDTNILIYFAIDIGSK